ncbi:50S ribosomal protein L25/general stress protein Ctc [Phytomonospora endophytica]|uniref:Large ribosomal subunit protein bL25 n=1 Tax=Phytomonospora endophytica TaxID=714109 RepID=A0A841FL78_9ACTN|nr:50S ribosomal protein L25/general stress protein Ctc [Phytomonospora endophytica]MBB6036685.1 large subunit ribosomal protein L25 [Phytomonospora endophytica]GIG66007.1 50S ribosomal protein L25 [Phytomonospora endophytica]
MSEVRISAEPRTEFGKGGARRTRRAGKIPAVLYGHGEKPKHVALPALEFAAALRRGGMNQLFTIEVTDGTKELALPKALQRDPIKDTIDHVDLLLVRKGELVQVELRINLVGEHEKGGLLVHEHGTLTVQADATALPEAIDVSIEGLAIGANVTAADVTFPEGTELVSDPSTVIATVTQAPSAEQMEGEESSSEAAVDEEPAAETAAE